jgi:hypothetical protein
VRGPRPPVRWVRPDVDSPFHSERRHLPLPCGLVTASMTLSKLKLPGFWRGGNSRKVCSY